MTDLWDDPFEMTDASPSGRRDPTTDVLRTDVRPYPTAEGITWEAALGGQDTSELAEVKAELAEMRSKLAVLEAAKPGVAVEPVRSRPHFNQVFRSYAWHLMTSAIAPYPVARYSLTLARLREDTSFRVLNRHNTRLLAAIEASHRFVIHSHLAPGDLLSDYGLVGPVAIRAPEEAEEIFDFTPEPVESEREAIELLEAED